MPASGARVIPAKREAQSGEPSPSGARRSWVGFPPTRFALAGVAGPQEAVAPGAEHRYNPPQLGAPARRAGPLIPIRRPTWPSRSARSKPMLVRAPAPAAPAPPAARTRCRPSSTATAARPQTVALNGRELNIVIGRGKFLSTVFDLDVDGQEDPRHPARGAARPGQGLADPRRLPARGRRRPHPRQRASAVHQRRAVARPQARRRPQHRAPRGRGDLPGRRHPRVFRVQPRGAGDRPLGAHLGGQDARRRDSPPSSTATSRSPPSPATRSRRKPAPGAEAAAAEGAAPAEGAEGAPAAEGDAKAAAGKEGAAKAPAGKEAAGAKPAAKPAAGRNRPPRLVLDAASRADACP